MILAIDLGTTNSLAAVWKDEKAVLIPNALGEFLTPSVVGLDDDGSVIIGKAARERLVTHPAITMANFKRYMGTSFRRTMGTHRFSPEEFSSFVLRSLKADAEAFLGVTIEEAIVTVPAYFNDTQRKATRNAGELAGLRVERLLNEPTAAALAYGLHRRDSETSFLVFDLGGGTFDISILELFEGVIEVRASAGDNQLGGEDFLEALITAFMESHGKAMGKTWNELPDILQNRIRRRIEEAKNSLSTEHEVNVSIHDGKQEHQWLLTRKTFETISTTLMGKLKLPIEKALHDARIRPSELVDIVLVGGATRMPMVSQLVTRMFGRFPRKELHPDEAIALGAAIQAGLKARDKALKGVVFTDVCPYTLGVKALSQVGPDSYQEVFNPIIERNTVVPTSREERFTTVAPKQKEVCIEIYQGESRIPENNIRLGQVSIPVPPNKAGEESVDVRFTYDINGLLEVEVTAVSTGKKETLIIEENPGTMTAEQIQTRMLELAELKIHPREKMVNRTLLAKADRLYAQSLGRHREVLGRYLDNFRAALDTQEERTIAKASLLLQEALEAAERNFDLEPLH